MKTLRNLQQYMTGRKTMMPGAVIISAISTITGMLPYIFIWLIVKEMLEGTGNLANSPVFTYAWWVMGSAVGGVALYFLALTLSHLAAFRVETNMRREAVRKIVTMPLGFFDSNTIGRIRKIVDDNASITHGFLAHQMPDLAGSILMPVVTTLLIFVFDWRMGLTCLVPVICAMVIMSFMMGKKGKHFMESYMNALEDMNTEAVEYVRGIPVVKVFQQTVFSFKNFHNSIVRYKDMVTAYTRMWETPMSTYTVLIHSFVYLLVPVTILLIGNAANYAGILADLFFYVLITPVFAQSIMKSMYLNQALGQATEAVKRVDNLFDALPLTLPETPISVVKFDVSFKNVVFSYPGATQHVINNISFDIPQGKTYALVGASGSGKTTLARMLPRFWDVSEGQVCIGGVDVRDIDQKELIQHVSFVFQNTRLFKTTIRENIKYGCPEAGNKDIDQAIDLAQCREIIDRLPNGLDTKIGSDGTYLSGGEQQRIALARAILKNAPIVVLDEATAFADPENEHLIQKALKTLTKGKTVLMIAHRLSSVMEVDQILVIKKGNIVEQDTHKNLITFGGVYAAMWNEYLQAVKWTVGGRTKNKITDANLEKS